MPDSSDIDSALVAKLSADTGIGGLMRLAVDGVFMDEAGKSLVTGGNAKQFVIVSLVDEVDEPVLGKRGFEDALYLVKFVELSTVSPSHVKAGAARIDALLEDGVLTVPGYTHMVLCRESRIRLLEVDEEDASIRWQHRGGQYRVQQAPV
ncbi:MAG TPA: hypothetical protein VGQ44_01460 [Gemmatimonadaceae bacterium]|jgi:hypothetical protein|nr:hypothetical protein [Gemmatimonadaceae bacterium]